MNKTIKAVLLSAFVCPGAGHFFLKKYKMGALFLSACCISFYFILVDVIEKAQQIVDQMVTGEIALDVVSVTENITANSEQSLNTQMYILIVIWIVSIIDSYRIGVSKKE
jgi:hypothetical protein